MIFTSWTTCGILRGTIRGDPQETLYCVRSHFYFSGHEAEKSVWVSDPSSSKKQQHESQLTMSGSSRHIGTCMCMCVCVYMCVRVCAYVCECVQRAHRHEMVLPASTSRRKGTAMQTSVGWFFHLECFSWSEGATKIGCCAELYTWQCQWFDLTPHITQAMKISHHII
jgi:hypothetical protein